MSGGVVDRANAGFEEDYDLPPGESLCPECGGRGDVSVPTQEFGPDDYLFEMTCPKCDGTGVVKSPAEPPHE